MLKPPFRFKQFSVAQDGCAMKVNTDGVLLGAWADAGDAKNILDIGTGTGVIALMMAQKNAYTIIDAIDIDQTHYEQAKKNFEQSLWSERFCAYHTSLQDYYPNRKYDLIISNPPYFVDDFKTEDHQRNIARHSISLSYQELISGISRLLADEGSAYLVLPEFNLAMVEQLATEQKLFVVELTEVIAVAGKEPYLALIKLSLQQKKYFKNTITIQHLHGAFTPQYKALTKDFYLKF